MYDNTLLILGLSVSPSHSGADPYIELQTHFPTKIDFCGTVTFTDETDDTQLSPDTLDVLKVTQLNLYIFKCKKCPFIHFYLKMII